MTALLTPDEALNLRLAITAASQTRNVSRVMIGKVDKLLRRLEGMEVPDLDAILDSLREMEERAVLAKAENVPNSNARAHCTGRAQAFRDAHSLVASQNVTVIG